jgi:hypothetical protein
MQLPKLNFPHISRVFSASLWILLFVFIVVNAFLASKNQKAFPSIFSSSLTHPFSVESHITTALALWNQGLQDSAKQEIRIADDLFHAGGESVLGSTSPPSTLLSEWESKPQQLKSDYAFWEMVASEKPEYRDGLIMAGLYAYQLRNIGESRKYLEKAYTLDPNYEPLNALLEKIGK